jgi:hypothetical protein
MEQVIRKINIIYYLVYTMTILATVIGYIFALGGSEAADPTSSLSISISSLVILYIIISIPGALALFHRYTKKLIPIQNEFEKLNKYTNGAIWRLLAVGTGLVISVIAFYILRSTSMIYCAGIAAIALFFCKPTEGKIMKELKMDETEE